MSMILGLTALSDASLDRLRRDPPLVWKVLSPDDPSMIEQERSRSRGFLARLFGRGAPPGAADNFAVPDGEGAGMDLDKAWHGLHYLFTGTAWEGDPPLNFLVCGGDGVGSIDVGYGPARAIGSGEVREIAAALGRLSPDELRGRYAPEDMMNKQIYPEFWNRDEDEDDPLGYCIGYFDELKAFVGDAASRKLGLLVHIS